MVNKPKIRPAISGGGSFGGGPARIPLILGTNEMIWWIYGSQHISGPARASHLGIAQLLGRAFGCRNIWPQHFGFSVLPNLVGRKSRKYTATPNWTINHLYSSNSRFHKDRRGNHNVCNMWSISRSKTTNVIGNIFDMDKSFFFDPCFGPNWYNI